MKFGKNSPSSWKTIFGIGHLFFHLSVTLKSADLLRTLFKSFLESHSHEHVSEDGYKCTNNFYANLLDCFEKKMHTQGAVCFECKKNDLKIKGRGVSKCQDIVSFRYNYVFDWVLS